MTEFSRRTLLGAMAASTVGAMLAPVRAFAAPGGTPPGARAVLTPADANGDVVIYQTSFEDDEPTWITSSSSYDATVARTGSRSLKYTRTDPSNYQLAEVDVPAEPGRAYSVSVFAKTADVSAGNRGAHVAIDAWDADGNWISGGYSGDVISDDWTELTAAYVTTAKVATLHVSVYLYKGVTGTAWFDDFTLTMVAPHLLTTELLSPSYRGQLIPGDWDEIALRVNVDVDADKFADYSLAVTLADDSGSAVHTQTYPAAAKIDYRYAAAALATGRYTLRAELTDTSTGESAGTEEWGLEKLADAPASYIDKHRRLIRNGELFFPLGFYNSTVDEQSVQELAGTPFNTLLSYSQLDATQLDLAADNGIAVIYSLKDYFYDSQYHPANITTAADEVPAIIDTVTKYRDHPALLAWYMDDESSILARGGQMAAHYAAVVATDPAHPAYEVSNKEPTPAGEYMRTTDAFGCDSYPVLDDSSAIGQPGQRASEAADLLVNRAMWHVPQSFARGALASGGQGRFPTLAEFRNMTWQFVAEGALGLVYYELYYMRRDPDLTFEQAMGIATAVGQEVADLVPMLLSIDAPPAATVPDEAWLETLVKGLDGTGYLFAVNNTRAAQSATFAMPAALSVTVRGEDRSLPVAPDGSFSDDFGPIAVHHYQVALVDYDSLDALTGEYLDDAPGVSTSASRLLRNARKASEQGPTTAAEHLLEAYRIMIRHERGRALTDAQVQTLVRLSEQLPAS
jgi:hypothetical protein